MSKAKYHQPYDFADRTTPQKHYTSRDGRMNYAIMVDGSVRRVSPLRPYRGKAERRQVIKQRRLAREKAAQSGSSAGQEPGKGGL